MEWGGEIRSDCCITVMFDTGKQEESKSGTGNREGKKVLFLTPRNYFESAGLRTGAFWDIRQK